MTFGDRVREKRLERGLTQEALGEIVGLKKSGVAKYENGRIRNVSTEMAVRFAEALGVSVHELLESFERSLYSLDFCISENADGVEVWIDGHEAKAFFPHDEWETIKRACSYSAVLAACQKAEAAKNKKAHDIVSDTEGLSEDKQYLINKIMSLTDEEVQGLRAIVDQVLALRGK